MGEGNSLSLCWVLAKRREHFPNIQYSKNLSLLDAKSDPKKWIWFILKMFSSDNCDKLIHVQTAYLDSYRFVYNGSECTEGTFGLVIGCISVHVAHKNRWIHGVNIYISNLRFQKETNRFSGTSLIKIWLFLDKSSFQFFL